MTDRRLAIVHVNPDDLVDLLDLRDTRTVIRHVETDHMRGVVRVLIESDLLPPVPECCEPPVVDPQTFGPGHTDRPLP